MRAANSHAKTVFVLAVLATAIGAYSFVYGQGLAALLVPNCPDFSSTAFPQICRQPRIYVLLGSGITLLGLTMSVAAAWRLFRRTRRERSS